MLSTVVIGCTTTPSTIANAAPTGGKPSRSNLTRPFDSTAKAVDPARRNAPHTTMTSDQHEKLGDICFARGDLKMAFMEFDKAVQLDRDSSRLLSKRGMVYIAGRMPGNAAADFLNALAKGPDNWLAYEGLGIAFFQMKRYEEAENHFRKALQINRQLWSPHAFLGIIYDYRERYEDAVREYAHAISLSGGNAPLYNNLGTSYLLNGNYEKAAAALTKAVSLTSTPSGRTYNNLGLALFSLGRYDEAFEAFKKAGDEAQAYNNMGCMYLLDGNYEKAMQSLGSAIELRPTFYRKAGENLEKCRRASHE
jgi:Flp pilus assembly protein TadD